MKHDVIQMVKDFFEMGIMDRRRNKTLVTLIPKHADAKSIKEFRPISFCTIVYKVIAKVMAKRMSRVLHSIISKSQASFVPGQDIHDHILLAYELVKGHSRKYSKSL